MRQSGKVRQRGFTLVELALVMGIVALLLGGLMVPVGRMLEQKANATTQATLETAQQAIWGFALLNQRLPCPDTGSDGQEGARNAAGACIAFTDPAGASRGHLPWAALGISGVDAWGSRLRYAVATPLVSNINKTSINATNLIVKCTTLTSPDIPGCLSGGVAVTLASNAAFVVYSHGKNQRGAVSADGLTTFPAPTPTTTNQDENANQPEQANTFEVVDPTTPFSPENSRRIFVFRSRTDATSVAGEFDDLMVWMPAPLLAAKLVAAGVWQP
ncbi:type II secretion system protein [Polaromonas sp. YR568]|uniref:type II secretion system protein n=1 Tax=Polaromonas sp. YR568 TaxID=1855301 RepID=UPI00398BF59F